MLNIRSLCLGGTLLTLAFAGPLAAQEVLTPERLNALKGFADRVERDHKNVSLRLRSLFEDEAGILRTRARTKADEWYRNGLPDYEQGEYQSLISRLAVLHQLEKQDYGYIHNLVPILGKRIVTLDIVYKGKAKKDAVILATTMHNIAKEEFRDQLMGNLYGTYLAALAEPTPAAAHEKMLQFRGFIESMAATDREAIEMETQKIQREMDYFMVSLIPGVGEAMALTEAYYGTSALGERLTWVDQAMALAGVVGAVGDVASVVKTAGKFPVKAGNTMNLLSGYIDNLTPAERVFINNKYPGTGVKALEDLSARSKVLRTPTGNEVTKVVDGINPKGMHIARQAMAEQNASLGKLGKVDTDEIRTLKVKAYAAVEADTPGLDFAKLDNPASMTDADFNDLQKSFDLGETEMAAIRKNPALAKDKIEQFTGVPIDALKAKADVFEKGEYAVMRNSNVDGLAALKNKEAVPKPLFMKGKSGVGGAVYTDQEFSKLSRDLDAAEAAGNTKLATEIRKDIAKSSADVESITREKELAALQLDLSKAHVSGNEGEARRLKSRINTIESTRQAATSNRVGDKTIVAVMVAGDDGRPVRSVMLRDKEGELFDINTRQLATNNASIVKNADGTDKTLSRVVDKRTGQHFVADADAHILGFKGGGADDLLSEDEIGGFMTNTEKKRLAEIARAQTAADQTPMMLHGGQVRYYKGKLPIDKKFYVIEKDKIRIVRNNGDQLRNIVHQHRLEGTVAPVDPRWQWGEWTPQEGFKK